MFGLLTKSLQTSHAHQPAASKSPSAAAPGGYADTCQCTSHHTLLTPRIEQGCAVLSALMGRACQRGSSPYFSSSDTSVESAVRLPAQPPSSSPVPGTHTVTAMVQAPDICALGGEAAWLLPTRSIT